MATYPSRDAERRATDLELYQMRLAELQGKFGSYAWNLGTDNLFWSPGMYALVERDPARGITVGEYVALIPEGNRTPPEKYPHTPREPEVVNEYPVHLPSGTVKWMRSTLKVYEVDGENVMMGPVIDVTESRRLNTQLQDAAQAAQDLLVVMEEIRKSALIRPVEP